MGVLRRIYRYYILLPAVKGCRRYKYL